MCSFILRSTRHSVVCLSAAVDDAAEDTTLKKGDIVAKHPFIHSMAVHYTMKGDKGKNKLAIKYPDLFDAEGQTRKEVHKSPLFDANGKFTFEEPKEDKTKGHEVVRMGKARADLLKDKEQFEKQKAGYKEGMVHRGIFLKQ
ncbi:hypothetical protein HYFRA_00008946 [Hymenoscyphus fraxineus]|uniref:Uncharacterized protein n=1 Tax=Hymenoscyphus fraxineus TaxID=746836 RepID=A0A9N9PSP6_9HELO|nr:hypothetical protein HYFRA_00008946 [Hymenoscyphus fraxineus]